MVRLSLAAFILCVADTALIGCSGDSGDASVPYGPTSLSRTSNVGATASQATPNAGSLPVLPRPRASDGPGGAPVPTGLPSLPGRPVGPAPPPPTRPPAFNDWPTYGYDNARDGFNPNSSAISPASLARLRLAWQTTLPNHDFNTQTQPVLATNVGSHAGLLVVGGGLGTVYAYDARTGAQVWAQPLGAATFSCNGSAPSTFGIAGSAVYDPSSASVYITSNANTATNGPTQVFINKLGIVDGSLQGRVNIAPAPLAGELNFSHTSLTLANGVLYAGTGSTCDIASWRGRVAAVNESAFTLTNSFFTVWNQKQALSPPPAPLSGGGVWGWGGVSIAPDGTVWTAVGNLDNATGTNGPQPPFVQDTTEFDAFAEHVLELTPDVSTVLQSNYPGFTFGGASVDLDLNGTPVIAQPIGCHASAAVQGKSGYLYLYDTTDVAAGPSAAYKFTTSSYNDPNLGNPAFSPLTGLYYAAVASGVAGGITAAPGMIAIQTCDAQSNVAWDTAFGPDSSTAKSPRSMPTVTAGGVVFVATPCLRDSTGGCTATTGKYGGALWALDATSGALLNGAKPLITTPSPIRMGAVVDADWVYLFDNTGHLYGLTIDGRFPAIADRFRALPAVDTNPLWR